MFAVASGRGCHTWVSEVHLNESGLSMVRNEFFLTSGNVISNQPLVIMSLSLRVLLATCLQNATDISSGIAGSKWPWGPGHLVIQLTSEYEYIVVSPRYQPEYNRTERP